MVLPDFQKQGIGRAIIDFALTNVDLGGLPVYLNSSLSGAPLYQKMGWKVVDTVTVGDATVEGLGSGGYVSSCMVAKFPPLRSLPSDRAKL
jgi:GNAT superfamily N-acetyltransferase